MMKCAKKNCFQTKEKYGKLKKTFFFFRLHAEIWPIAIENCLLHLFSLQFSFIFVI